MYKEKDLIPHRVACPRRRSLIWSFSLGHHMAENIPESQFTQNYHLSLKEGLSFKIFEKKKKKNLW